MSPNTDVTPVACSFSVSGEGPPVYFVHGIGASRHTWENLIPLLDDAYTCVSYDLRGHGVSPCPPVPYSLDDLVADLEALRAQLGHERIHVVGHSLGGMIGPAYARAYHEHTLSVGLLSTAAFRTEDDSAKVLAVVQAMKDKGIGPMLDALTDRWFTEDFMARRPEVIQARKERVLATPADVFMDVFRIYATTEMAPWLHEVTAPCLVLTGELDGGCNPRLNRQIAAALPDSELIILDGLKHAIMLEASDRVAPPLRTFLDRVGTR